MPTSTGRRTEKAERGPSPQAEGWREERRQRGPGATRLTDPGLPNPESGPLVKSSPREVLPLLHARIETPGPESPEAPRTCRPERVQASEDKSFQNP